MNKVRIFWINKVNGFTGHGSYITVKCAIAAIKRANNRYKELTHWIES